MYIVTAVSMIPICILALALDCALLGCHGTEIHPTLAKDSASDRAKHSDKLVLVVSPEVLNW